MVSSVVSVHRVGVPTWKNVTVLATSHDTRKSISGPRIGTRSGVIASPTSRGEVRVTEIVTMDAVDRDFRVGALPEEMDMVVPAVMTVPIQVVGDQMGVIDTLVVANDVHLHPGTERTNCPIGSARVIEAVIKGAVGGNRSRPR